MQEAERLHQLRHANIIALYGVCLSGPIGILLMVSSQWCGDAPAPGACCKKGGGHLRASQMGNVLLLECTWEGGRGRALGREAEEGTLQLPAPPCA